MAETPRKAEIPISFPTKQAEADLQKTKHIFSKTVSSMKAIEERTGIFKTLGSGIAGVTPGVASYLLQSPTVSKPTAALQAGGNALQTLSTIVGGIFGNAAGAIIGNVVGQTLNEFTNSLGEEVRNIKDKSLNEVQSIATQFAEVGVLLEKDTIKALLSEREQINKRVFEAMKEVKETQNAQTQTTSVIKNTAARKLSDAMSYLGF